MQNTPGHNAHTHPVFQPVLALMSGATVNVGRAIPAANDEPPPRALTAADEDRRQRLAAAVRDLEGRMVTTNDAKRTGSLLDAARAELTDLNSRALKAFIPARA